MSTRTRSAGADFVKAVAIFLVVLGHSAGLNASLRGVIYAFHVPAFLLVTGYLLPESFARAGPRETMRRHIRPFLRLYLFFSLISVLIMAAGLALKGRAVVPAVLQALFGLARGVEGPFDGFIHANGPLWYFPMLIVSLLAVRLAAALPWPDLSGSLLLLVGTAGGIALSGTWWPWYLQFAAIGGLFVWTGWRARPALNRLGLRLADHRGLRMALALGLSALLVAAVPEGPGYNLNRGRFGETLWMFPATALCGTAALALWGQILPHPRIVRLLSEHTLVIFCTHIYLVRLTRAFPPDLPDALPRLALLALWATLVCAICLGLSLAVTPWLRRHVIGGGGERVAAREATSPTA